MWLKTEFEVQLLRPAALLKHHTPGTVAVYRQGLDAELPGFNLLGPQLESDLLKSVTVHHSDYAQAVQRGDDTELMGAATNWKSSLSRCVSTH